MKKLILFLSGVLFLLFLWLIFHEKLLKTIVNIPQNKIKIMTSFYPLYFFASQIGGNKMEIKNITPAGAEPHDYEPTPQDIARIEKSDLLILNGGSLETWGNKIKDDLKGKSPVVIVAGEKMFDQKTKEKEEKVQDPHIWLSPPLVKQEIKIILQSFIQIDPKNKEYYSKNADIFLKKLDELDDEYKQGLSHCKKNDFVTSHAAFGYLAKAYDLNQIAISGVSPDEEPSTQKLAEIAEFAKKNNIKYIFFESLLSPKLSETIASEVGAKTLVLDPIEGISDNDVKAGKNYITVMENNLKNLQIALECK